MTTYTVQTDSFCGMTLPHGEYDDYAEARSRLKRRADWAREEGCNVEYLSPTTVEIGEPDNCGFIPDYCGILRIKKVETEHECRGCNELIPLDQRYCEDCA